MIDNRLLGSKVEKLVDRPNEEWDGKWAVVHPTLNIVVAVCDTKDEAEHARAAMEAVGVMGN